MLSARYVCWRINMQPRASAKLMAQVRVVQHKHTKTLFALKYINKAKCVKMKAVANIVQERRLLEEVSPTFERVKGSSQVVHRDGARRNEWSSPTD